MDSLAEQNSAGLNCEYVEKIYYGIPLHYILLQSWSVCDANVPRYNEPLMICWDEIMELVKGIPHNKQLDKSTVMDDICSRSLGRLIVNNISTNVALTWYSMEHVWRMCVCVKTAQIRLILLVMTNNTLINSSTAKLPIQLQFKLNRHNLLRIGYTVHCIQWYGEKQHGTLGMAATHETKRK